MVFGLFWCVFACCPYDSCDFDIRQVLFCRIRESRFRRRLKRELRHIKTAAKRTDVCSVCQKFDKMVVPQTKAPEKSGCSNKTAAPGSRRGEIFKQDAGESPGHLWAPFWAPVLFALLAAISIIFLGFLFSPFPVILQYWRVSGPCLV